MRIFHNRLPHVPSNIATRALNFHCSKKYCSSDIFPTYKLTWLCPYISVLINALCWEAENLFINSCVHVLTALVLMKQFMLSDSYKNLNKELLRLRCSRLSRDVFFFCYAETIHIISHVTKLHMLRYVFYIKWGLIEVATYIEN